MNRFEEKKRKKQKLFLFAFPILCICGIFVLMLLGDNIFMIPECYIHKNLGLLCTGCGNTRALRELIKGNLLLSLRYNPTIIAGVIFVILLYMDILFSYMGIKIKCIPRSLKFWIPFIIIWTAFLFTRNFIPYYYEFL